MKISICPGEKYRLADFLRIPLGAAPGAFSFRLLFWAMSALLPSALVLVSASFVDTATAIFNGTADAGSIFLPLGLIFLLVFYSGLQWNLEDWTRKRLDMGMERVFRQEMTSKRARMRYRYVEDNDSWDLISRTSKDPVGQIRDGFEGILSMGSLVVQALSLLFILLVQVWWAGLVIVFFTVPLFFLAIKGGRESYQASKEAEKELRRAQYLDQVLTGREPAEERALFGYSEKLSSRWYERFIAAWKLNFKVNAKYFIRMKSASLLTVLICFVIVFVLLFPLARGEITAGIFIGLVTAVFSLVQAMSWQLSYAAKTVAKGREYLKDLTAFANMEEDEGALEAPLWEKNFKVRTIEFDRVTFSYPGTELPILRDFSLTLEEGRHYAFVGINGAGKTTITKLLTGMYREYEGEIRINGVSLKEYSLPALKSIFSVVYQDFARYFIEAGENIALGNVNEYDREKIRGAAAQIDLDEVISALPKGYETPLGRVETDGVDLSGGQWQRLAIARSLYSPAQVRILDEPTAALDPVAESEVYRMFGEISKGKTTVFITHRLGAARLADEIIVLDQGRAAEKGSHEELMEKGGIYAGMFESQRSWYE